MNDRKQSDAGRSRPPVASGRTVFPRINSAELFKGNRHLVIDHGEEEYRLQQTRSGKLILTK